jgi:hypothetical protein
LRLTRQGLPAGSATLSRPNTTVKITIVIHGRGTVPRCPNDALLAAHPDRSGHRPSQMRSAKLRSVRRK